MKRKSNNGSLTVVGTGIEAITHVTLQARDAIEQADKVFYQLVDTVTEKWVRARNRTAESIGRLYGRDKARGVTYSEMVEEILRSVRKGSNVCAVFYGHPGVFCTPGHESISPCARGGLLGSDAAGDLLDGQPGRDTTNCEAS